MSSEEERKLDELLSRELRDPSLAEGLGERIMARLPEGGPSPVIGWRVYVAMAAAAVIFMLATLLMSSPWEIFSSTSRLTASIMVANFGAMLIATGFLGWVAETADFENSFVGMAIQSVARHPMLRLTVNLLYGLAVVIAVIWVMRPGSALVLAVSSLGPSHGQAVGTLGIVFLCGLCLLAMSRLAESAEARLDRVRVLRSFARIVIVAACVVHFALLVL